MTWFKNCVLIDKSPREANYGANLVVYEIDNPENVTFKIINLPEEIKKFIGNRNIKANIFRVQANNSVMCGYLCIGFIDFMLTGKTLIDYTNLFSPYDFNKNDSIILSYFKDA